MEDVPAQSILTVVLVVRVLQCGTQLFIGGPAIVQPATAQAAEPLQQRIYRPEVAYLPRQDVSPVNMRVTIVNLEARQSAFQFHDGFFPYVRITDIELSQLRETFEM